MGVRARKHPAIVKIDLRREGRECRVRRLKACLDEIEHVDTCPCVLCTVGIAISPHNMLLQPAPEHPATRRTLPEHNTPSSIAPNPPASRAHPSTSPGSASKSGLRQRVVA